MRRVLTSKPSFSGEKVAEVWANIGDYVTEAEASDAVDKAVAEVQREIGPGLRDRVVYGWSGGKDSVALQVVMDRAGIRRAVLGIIPHVEWQQYLGWVDQHKPEGLTVYPNHDITVPWLAQPGHAQYLFPRNPKDGYWWALMGTRRAQHRYQDDHQPELQIYGRRSADGNVCGDPATGIMRSRRLTAYCPLRAWSHEMVLAVVHYYMGRQLPAVYDYPSGWKSGTGAWAGRRVGTIEESWADTWRIEPDRVREAAEHIAGARDWLDRNIPF